MYGITDNKRKLKEAREQLNVLYNKIPDTKGCMQNNRPESEGGCGAWCCLLPETLVYTSLGPIPIKDVTEGMHIVTKGGWKNVIRTGSRYVKENIVHLSTCYGRSIKLTSNHEVYAELIDSTDRYIESRPVFIEAGKLIAKKSHGPGHFLIFPKISWEHDTKNDWFILDILDYVPDCFSIKNGDEDVVYNSKNMRGSSLPRYMIVDAKFARIIGLFLAEGSFDDSQLNFHFDTEETDLHQEVRDFANRFGLKCTWRRTRGRSFTMRIFSRVLNKLFRIICNSGCENKKIDNCFLDNLSKSFELVKALHDGYYDGDGSVAMLKKQIYSVCTTSNALAEQMVYINHLLGRIVGIYNYQSPNKKSVWTLTNDQSGKYKDYIETSSDFRIPLRNVAIEEYEGLVYDIEIEDEHSFMTEAGEVHNCKTQTPQVLYTEFLNTWKGITKDWDDSSFEKLIEKCLRKYLFPNKDKSCVFIDMQTNKCLQHETRPFNCRIYGITPEEEFKPRYERLKVIYPDARDQCHLVSTVNDKPVTTRDTNNWWLELNAIEMSVGIKKETITDEPGGCYRTYHDHILIHILGDKGMEQLSLLREKGNPNEKEHTIIRVMKAVKLFREKSNETKENATSEKGQNS